MIHPREWFEPKVVGFGWTPRTWEGWMVIVAMIVTGAVIGQINT